MSDLQFNAFGKTHTLRIRRDVENGETIVYEALIDTEDYVWFEGPNEIEVWDLFELAISKFKEYRVEKDTIKTRWRD